MIYLTSTVRMFRLRDGRQYKARVILAWVIAYWIAFPKVNAQTTEWEVFYSSNSGLVYNRVFAIAEDSSGSMWIGTERGVGTFKDGSWESFAYDSLGVNGISIDDIITGADGAVYIGVSGWLLIGKGGKWRAQPNALKDCFFFDQDGILWGAGGPYLSLGKYDGQSLALVDRIQHINSACMDSSRNKWAVRYTTRVGQISKYDGVNVTMWQYGNGAYSIGTMSDGRLFAGTDEGITVFTNGQQERSVYTRANSGIPNDNVTAILPRSDGTAWIGTKGGIAYFDGSSWTPYTMGNSRLQNNVINDLCLDTKGNLWIATESGLAVFREGGVVLDISQTPPLPEEIRIAGIAPNPAYAHARIAVTMGSGLGKLVVTDFLGRQVRTFVDIRGRSMIEWDLVGHDGLRVPPGVYLLQLQSQHGVATGKLLVR